LNLATVLRWGVLGGAAFVAISACTLTVDLDALEDRKCPGGQKFCDGACVDTSNPRYGCRSTGCNPCNLAYAMPSCDSGQCRIAACTSNRADCDGETGNGCEVDVNYDPNHCGVCNKKCAPQNATPDCASGKCAYRACAMGFSDCNDNRADGCEVSGDCP
jgi:hypothetical protein